MTSFTSQGWELVVELRGTRYRMVVSKGGPKGGGAYLFAFPDLWMHYAVELSFPVGAEWLASNGCPKKEAKTIASCIERWFEAVPPSSRS